MVTDEKYFDLNDSVTCECCRLKIYNVKVQRTDVGRLSIFCPKSERQLERTNVTTTDLLRIEGYTWPSEAVSSKGKDAHHWERLESENARLEKEASAARDEAMKQTTLREQAEKVLAVREEEGVRARDENLDLKDRLTKAVEDRDKMSALAYEAGTREGTAISERVDLSQSVVNLKIKVENLRASISELLKERDQARESWGRSEAELRVALEELKKVKEARMNEEGCEGCDALEQRFADTARRCLLLENRISVLFSALEHAQSSL